MSSVSCQCHAPALGCPRLSPARSHPPVLQLTASCPKHLSPAGLAAGMVVVVNLVVLLPPARICYQHVIWTRCFASCCLSQFCLYLSTHYGWYLAKSYNSSMPVALSQRGSSSLPHDLWWHLHMSFKSTKANTSVQTLQGCVVVVPTTPADGWDAASGAVALAHVNFCGHLQVISRSVVCLLSVHGRKDA